MKEGAWKPALVAMIVLASLPSAAQARPGDLDPAFSTDGLGQYPVARQAGTGTIPADVVPSVSMTPAGLEPDGDVILGGTTEYSWDCGHVGCQHNDSFLALARVQPTGELDPGFGNGGAVETDLGFHSDSNFGPIWGPVHATVGDDGRTVAAFGALEGYGPPQPRVARFLGDGSLDPSFSDDGIAAPPGLDDASQIEAVTIQADGRIVLVGRVDAHNYSPFAVDADLLVVRLLPDGDPDPAFGGGDGVRTYNFGPDDRFADVALDDQGRIVLAGTGSHASTVGDTAFTHDVAVARLLADGAPDPSFSDDGHTLFDLVPDRGSNAVFGELTIAGDRPVVLAAAHPDAIGFEGIFTALVRLDGSGDPDSSFGSGGIERLEQIADIQGPGSAPIDAQADGSLLIGAGGGRSLLLGRRLANGAPDPGFGDSGWILDYPATGFSQGGAGLVSTGARALIGGGTADGSSRAQLARFRLDAGPPDDRDADGVLDPGDRCPGVYAPGARRKGCPPPFSMRVTLDRWKRVIGGELSGETLPCAPEKMGILRKRPGRDKRVGRVDRSNMGITEFPFMAPFDGGWSVARTGPLRRGGRLYVRSAPRFDPTVGECEGDRSKVVRIPSHG